MPTVEISRSELAEFGIMWKSRGGRLSRTPPRSSTQLANLLDTTVGQALAVMLGGIDVVRPNANSLSSSEPECVEVGPVRIMGGVRSQNFDVGYRPDGVRFAFDSKTLNDIDSIRKNWQNMVNDLSTEATNVHSRFPHAVVAFMVAYPSPCLMEPQRSAIIETLERLARRSSVEDPVYMAEVISFVLWNPDDGTIDPTLPDPSSVLRIEKFSVQVQEIYTSRYKGLPPHAL